MAGRGRSVLSPTDKGQEQVAAQTDSEVHTAFLGALRNTLGRWSFYERIKFLCEHKGVGGKWDYRIEVGTAETWGHESHKFLADTRHQTREYKYTKE